ncbi:Uncharacterised protein [Psychrobacter phenylpyruvicus]|uniref:Uncharacterized protein n=1 Tax=Psychrobacter phenylpyruvicus TaxID=29432 RepID=A0A379LN85_9GAMM|nr:Uncharacterised protein [Psychrobacter phenylpyruvicus]
MNKPVPISQIMIGSKLGEDVAVLLGVIEEVSDWR